MSTSDQTIAAVLLMMVVACATYTEPPERPRDSDASSGTSAGGGQAGLGAGGASSGAPPQGGKGPSSGGSSGASGSGSAGRAGGAGAAGASGAGGAGGSAAGSAGSAASGEGGAGGGEGSELGQTLRELLIHRYDFEGTGVAVMDREGSAHGTIVGGATLSRPQGEGVVVLGGGSAGSYVNLPNGLISKLSSATLEAWLTWAGGPAWQRVFDFGDTTAASPEDMPATGKSYLFLTPSTDQSPGGMLRGVFSLQGGAAAAETRVESTSALPLVRSHVALVVDAGQGALRLYLNGKPAGSEPFSGLLSGINDVNCWLGRSQYSADPELGATFHEFRVYSAALDDAQIAFSAAAGPDAAFLTE